MAFRLVTRVGMGTRDPRVLAALAMGFLRGVVASNRVEMRNAKRRGHPFPKLYESGVEYEREPWAGRFEEFADARTVLRRGWGDCDDLAAYRLAELLEAGEPEGYPCMRHAAPRKGCPDCKQGAHVRIYWRPRKPGGSLLMHVQVRRADGSVEDPSRFLGL